MGSARAASKSWVFRNIHKNQKIVAYFFTYNHSHFGTFCRKTPHILKELSEKIL